MAAAASVLAAYAPTAMAAPAPSKPSQAAGAKLRVWMENAFLKEIDDYNAATFKEWGTANNVEVEFTAAATAPYRERLAASVGTDAVPAISQNFSSLLAQWRGRGQLIAVTDLVNKLNAKAGGFMPVALALVSGGQEYWGVPWGLDPVVMHVRQDLLDKAGLKYPATWDEFRETCKEIQKANPGVFGWAMPLGNDADTDNSFLPILWSYGGSYCNEDGSLAFKSDAMLQAIELVRKMYKEDKIIPSGAVAWDGSGNNKAYQAKQAAFAYNSVSIYAWATANDADLARATKLYPPPAGPKGSFGVLTGWGLCIFKGTKDVDLAKSALEYYFDPDRYTKLIQIGKGRLSPVYHDVLFSDFFTKHEVYSQIPTLIDAGRLYSYPAPLNAAVGDMLETFVVPEMLQSVVTSDVSPETAMNTAYEKAKGIWAKYGLN
jgi:multiple sugar transport system substrate-binding protein